MVTRQTGRLGTELSQKEASLSRRTVRGEHRSMVATSSVVRRVISKSPRHAVLNALLSAIRSN